MRYRSLLVAAAVISATIPWPTQHIVTEQPESIADSYQSGFHAANGRALNFPEQVNRKLLDRISPPEYSESAAVKAPPNFVLPPPPSEMSLTSTTPPPAYGPTTTIASRPSQDLLVPPPPEMHPLTPKYVSQTPHEAPIESDKQEKPAERTPVLMRPISMADANYERTHSVCDLRSFGTYETNKIAQGGGRPPIKLLPPPEPETPPTIIPTGPPKVSPATLSLLPSPEEQERYTGLPRDYRLGPGDQLVVIDPALGTPESPNTVHITVAPDGNVVIYPIGMIPAAGMTIADLNNYVNERAKEFELNPHLSVALFKERKITVYVLGDVVSPGLWTAGAPTPTEREQSLVRVIQSQNSGQNSTSGGATNTFVPFGQAGIGTMGAQPLSLPAEVAPGLNNANPAPLTALTAIQLAGGIRESADIRHVSVRRRSSGKVFNVDLWKLLAEGDFEQDLLLQSGDVVYVPQGGPSFDVAKLGQAANQYRFVRVWGEVRAPGLYILTPQDDLFSVVARAGGFTTVADTSKLEISRQNRDGSITSRNVTLKGALRASDPIGRQKVLPGDVIIAKTSFAKKYGPSFANRVAIAAGAILLLYLSRNIVDHSVNNTNGTTTVRLGF